MSSKRDFNEAINRAIQDAEHCIADLKRLKSGRIPGRPVMFILDLVHRGDSFVHSLNRLFGILCPPPPPVEEPIDADGDRHVAIRNRTKRIESRQLALPPAEKKNDARQFEGDPSYASGQQGLFAQLERRGM